MEFTLVQNEMEQALRDYLDQFLELKPDTAIGFKFFGTRGADGFTCKVSINGTRQELAKADAAVPGKPVKDKAPKNTDLGVPEPVAEVVEDEKPEAPPGRVVEVNPETFDAPVEAPEPVIDEVPDTQVGGEEVEPEPELKPITPGSIMADTDGDGVADTPIHGRSRLFANVRRP